ncbi:serine/threonine protein kinase [Paenibacillus sp. DYY-L-2]|uniref:serine/threonine protein kinase n=1 Tax=Paenibacillus sp. DYY-L-2 TaxID=3447013 RepID=UPI003F509F9E
MELIGEGSYGLTYKCSDLKDGGLVAVKQSRPSKGAFARQLLEREAGMLQSLRHPQFPEFIELFTEGSYFYLVMSYLSGDTFEDLIFGQGKRYGEQDCILIAMQLLELVSFIHERGFVHLDLRIPNVLKQNDLLFILDFGLARKKGESCFPREADRKWNGKKRTSSLSFKSADERTDLQDIGHFMLFLLYSAFEPEKASGKNQNSQPERSWQDELELTEDLKTIIERLLELQTPYACSSHFMNDLRRIANDY